MIPSGSVDPERRRALARKLLATDPANERAAAALQELLSPLQIQAAVQQGILLVGEPDTEAMLRVVAEALAALALRVYLDVVQQRVTLSPHLTQVGVVVLMMWPTTLYNMEVQHRYGVAMTIGKVVLPVMIGSAPPPPLFFDLPIVRWGADTAENLALIRQALHIGDTSPTSS